MTLRATSLAILAVALVAAPALAQDYKAPGYVATASAAPVPPVPPAVSHHGVVIVDGQVIRAEDMSPEQRARFDAKMREVDTRMARLNERLRTQDVERQARIKQVVADAEARAHAAMARAQMAQSSPERIRAITERAEAAAHRAEYGALSFERIHEITERAQRQAEAGMRAAEAAQRAVDALQPELDRMQHELEQLDR